MKNIVVVGFDTEYGLLDVEALRKNYCVEHVCIHPFLIFFLLGLYSLSKALFCLVADFIFSQYLKNIADDAIFFSNDNIISLRVHFSAAAERNRKILIFRNTFNHQVDLNYLGDVEKYSFDKGDCDRYGFLEYSQYCSGFNYISEHQHQHQQVDFYFLGLDKGRRNILRLLESKLSNYNTSIDIREQPTGLKQISNYFFKERKYQYVDYFSHLDNILACKVVIDIVKGGQSGVTMRTAEAIVAGKKIITNNKAIINEPFYNSRTVMLIDESVNIGSKEISDFIYGNAVELDESIINDFSASNVFQSILD